MQLVQLDARHPHQRRCPQSHPSRTHRCRCHYHLHAPVHLPAQRPPAPAVAATTAQQQQHQQQQQQAGVPARWHQTRRRSIHRHCYRRPCFGHCSCGQQRRRHCCQRLCSAARTPQTRRLSSHRCRCRPRRRSPVAVPVRLLPGAGSSPPPPHGWCDACGIQRCPGQPTLALGGRTAHAWEAHAARCLRRRLAAARRTGSAHAAERG